MSSRRTKSSTLQPALHHILAGCRRRVEPGPPRVKDSLLLRHSERMKGKQEESALLKSSPFAQ